MALNIKMESFYDNDLPDNYEQQEEYYEKFDGGRKASLEYYETDGVAAEKQEKSAAQQQYGQGGVEFNVLKTAAIFHGGAERAAKESPATRCCHFLKVKQHSPCCHFREVFVTKFSSIIEPQTEVTAPRVGPGDSRGLGGLDKSGLYDGRL